MFGEAIEQEALKWDLDVRLVAAVIAVESKGQPHARRYEHGFFVRYIEGKTNKQLRGHFPTDLSRDTELYERSCSWGLMQLMGQVAREMGYTGDMVDLMFRPEVNIAFGCAKLGKLVKKHKFKLRPALLEWNGGGNSEYPDKVLEAVDSDLAKQILEK